jgi:hypothetical protein
MIRMMTGTRSSRASSHRMREVGDDGVGDFLVAEVGDRFGDQLGGVVSLVPPILHVRISCR